MAEVLKVRRFRRCAVLLLSLRLLFAKCQVAFLDESFDKLVQQFFEERSFVIAFVLGEHLLDLLLVDEAFFEQCLEEGASQGVE